jgi:exopolysaccharide biosynthesis polyprenyl glycosylphosphotransferase
MTPLHRQIMIKILMLFDLIIASLAFFMTTYVLYYRVGPVSFERFLSMRVKVQNFAIFLGFLLIWHILLLFYDLYKSRRLSPRWGEIVDIIKATTTGTLVLLVTAVIFSIQMVTPSFLITFWATSTAGTIFGRSLLRFALKQMRMRDRNLRFMLIVGTNPRAVQFAREMERKREFGYRVLGFIDENWEGSEKFQESGYPLVADFNGFSDFIRDNVVDEVAICLPVKSLYDQINEVVKHCENQGIIVRFITDLFDLKIGESTTEQIEGHSVITVFAGAMKGWQVFVKRCMDFCLSLVLMILLFSLFLVTSISIKLTSPGPVFFIQERVGRGKRRFRLYKFRTMVQGAEKKQAELEHLNEVSGPVFKIKDDPRITTIGRVLRKTSIDEIPQLINVLKGDMSLVGPRPLPVRDYEGFDQDWHRRRFSVHPGITCLWQINGRSDLPFEKWMELDMEYIDNWSLGLDLKIMAKTIPSVLSRSGAS